MDPPASDGVFRPSEPTCPLRSTIELRRHFKTFIENLHPVNLRSVEQTAVWSFLRVKVFSGSDDEPTANTFSITLETINSLFFPPFQNWFVNKHIRENRSMSSYIRTSCG